MSGAAAALLLLSSARKNDSEFRDKEKSKLGISNTDNLKRHKGSLTEVKRWFENLIERKDWVKKDIDLDLKDLKIR